jgi:hypothetical protein
VAIAAGKAIPINTSIGIAASSVNPTMTSVTTTPPDLDFLLLAMNP